MTIITDFKYAKFCYTFDLILNFSIQSSDLALSIFHITYIDKVSTLTFMPDACFDKTFSCKLQMFHLI